MSRFSAQRRSVLRPTAALGALVIATAGLTALPASATKVGDVVTLDIVGITDFHGALEQAPYLAGQIDAIKTANPDTVFVSAGDNIGGSTYASAIQQDQPTIDVLNAMGLEASAVGNHEFDQGYGDLSGRVVPAADWTYLGANVNGESPELASYHLWEAAGVTVGFIGTVTTDTPSIVAADGIQGLTFAPEAATTNAVATQLTDSNDTNGEADVIVALAHTGVTPEFMNALDATLVDAVFAGHSHVEVNETAPIPVIQGGASGANLSRMTITYNTTSGATAATGTNISLDTEANPDLPTNATVQGLVDEALAEAEVLGREVVGTVDGPLNNGANTGGDPGSNRGTESPLGNLLGDVAKWTVEQNSPVKPDFGIINPGGVRAPLDADNDGKITYAEAFATQPFGNTVGTIDLTGAQVIQMLEEQFQDPTQDRPVLRLGLSEEIRYVYDPSAERGSMITKVFVDDAPISPTETYTVASNTFLIAPVPEGTDAPDGFAAIQDGTNFTETGVVDLQGLVDYLAAHPQLSVDYSQRSVGITPKAAPVAGQQLTVDLASLGFTTTEPKPIKADVRYGNQVLASTTTFDHAITDKSDETGRASVTFTVPAGFTGVGDLVVDLTLEPRSTPGGQEFGFFLNDSWSGKANHEFMYGKFTDEVLIGDFDGDGTDSITVRRGNQYYINNAPHGGQAEKVISYGRPSDTVLVGDFNGDGTDTLAVRRGNVYHVKNTLTSGPADQIIGYGRPGDTVLVGNFDGQNGDSFTVRRGNTYYVKNTIASGNADQVIAYGKPTDTTLTGDFNGDGTDTFAVRRGNAYHVKNTITGGPADFVQAYGRTSDEVYVGDWNGDNTDTLGVRRHP